MGAKGPSPQNAMRYERVLKVSWQCLQMLNGSRIEKKILLVQLE